MLKSLKSKLSSVKSEVTVGIRKVGLLADSLVETPTEEKSLNIKENGNILDHNNIDVTARSPSIPDNGSSDPETNDALQDLLHSYEESWTDIICAGQSNISHSKAASAQAIDVQKSLSQSSKSVNQLENELQEFSTITTQITSLSSQIATINSLCAEVEDSLALLLNASENLDMEKTITSELNSRIVTEQKKRKEYEIVIAKQMSVQREQALAAELKEAELRRQKELFYKKAFEEDMERYKAQLKARQVKDLSAVILPPSPEDQKELDKFLEDEDVGKSQANSIEHTTPDAENDEVIMRDRSDTNPSSQDRSSEGSLEWDEEADHLQITLTADDLPQDITLDDIVSPDTASLPEQEIISKDIKQQDTHKQEVISDEVLQTPNEVAITDGSGGI